MKSKKTIIMLICVLIASMGIVLTGCGNSSSGDKYADSPYVGTWEPSEAELDGVEYSAGSEPLYPLERATLSAW